MPTAATNPVVAVRAFLRHARDHGARVALTYGQVDMTGYVLTVNALVVDVQDLGGGLHTILLSAITEAVEL